MPANIGNAARIAARVCRRFTLLLVGSAAAFAFGAEIAATGISVPFFDSAGKLTHKLVAKQGSMLGPVQRLQLLEIVYFSSDDSQKIVQRVEAARAVWNASTQRLTGDGTVTVETEDSRLRGEDFEFAVATSLLHIRRNFRLENAEMAVLSDRAVVELLVQKSGEKFEIRDVKRAEAHGNLRVEVNPAAAKRFHFDRAFSELAIYDGSARTITLPKPTRHELAGKPVGEVATTVITLKR